MSEVAFPEDGQPTWESSYFSKEGGEIENNEGSSPAWGDERKKDEIKIENV